MLVLGRHRNEIIMIGDDIEVVVVDIRGNKVQLGINAPKQIGVHRKEVYDKLMRPRARKTDPERPAAHLKDGSGSIIKRAG